MLTKLDTSQWTKSDMVREARLQTDMIQRLRTWLRLAYSLVAAGFIIGLWASQAGSLAGMIGAGVCIVLGAPAAVVLKVGVTRAKRNVGSILEAAGVELDETGAPSAPADGGVEND